MIMVAAIRIRSGSAGHDQARIFKLLARVTKYSNMSFYGHLTLFLTF